ncbi:hypothetical protein LCGC14_1921750 [marine sediment metagenome]|uniref:Uncharacterized protein n=1 Tax=marine sediment metagenome TaxID=412755 RepID=A0A0F9GDZ9_9ZZZZ
MPWDNHEKCATLKREGVNLIQLKLDKLRYAAELRDIRFRILLLKLKEEQ